MQGPTLWTDRPSARLATFEEDIDVASGKPGVRIRGDSLAVWKESGMNLRTFSEGATMNNWALTVGWNNRIAGEDTTRTGPPAALELALSDSLAAALVLTERHSLDLLLMPTADLPGPRADPDTAKKSAADSAKQKAKPAPKPKRNDGEPEKPPVDLSVALADFRAKAPQLNLADIRSVRFVFDRAVAGTVLLDDVGFSRLPAGFWN
jgi:hypothetical protein